MSNLSLVPDVGDEMPSQQVARRIRGVMAEHKISGRTLAAAMHMDQKAFSRRYSGQRAWSFDEIVQLCSLLNLELSDLYAMRDLNPQPADLGETRSDLRLVRSLVGDDLVNRPVTGSSETHEPLEP